MIFNTNIIILMCAEVLNLFSERCIFLYKEYSKQLFLCIKFLASLNVGNFCLLIVGMAKQAYVDRVTPF